MSEPINWPTGHQTESSVKRLPDANGINSKNSAPSTGLVTSELAKIISLGSVSYTGPILAVTKGIPNFGNAH